MNKEKQIEEMACKKCLHFEACQVAFRNSKALSIYEDDYTEEEYFADTLDCDYYLDKTIYRKASEVAEEIFAEIEKYDRRPLPECEAVYVIKASEFAELKKKYESEDTE